MRLTSWSVDGYRNLHNVDLDLSDGLIIVGDNNSGKSNLIRSIFDYGALIGTIEQSVPEYRYTELPYRTERTYSEDGDSPEEDSVSSDENSDSSDGTLTTPVRPDVSYEDWVENRVSDGDSVTFQATFEPDDRGVENSNLEESEMFSEYIREVMRLRDAHSGYLEFVNETDGFTEFTHKLVISDEGIEEEYAATDIDGQTTVIAGRLPSGDVVHVIYQMFRRENDSVPITELQLSSMTPGQLEELTATEPESREDHIWFEPSHDEDTNEHGSVIHTGLRSHIQSDIRGWSHIPAVRRPPVLERYETNTDSSELADDFSNLLFYLNKLPKERKSDVVGGYRNILSEVSRFNINLSMDDDELLVEGEQIEVNAEQSFSSKEISTGSWEVLCLLTGVASHFNRSNSDDSNNTEDTPDRPGSILAIEEPETHLSPRTQRILINTFLNQLNGKIHPIITSHSPTVIDEGRLGSQVFVSKSEYTQVQRINQDTVNQVQAEFGLTLSDLIAANKLLLVPSQLWACMIRGAASQYEINPLTNGVKMVVCSTVSELSTIHEICEVLDTGIASLTEWDDRELIDEGASRGGETVYRFDINQLTGDRERLQKPYSYLYAKVDEDILEDLGAENISAPTGIDEDEWVMDLKERAKGATWTTKVMMYHTVRQSIDQDSPLDQLITTLQGFIEATPTATAIDESQSR